MVCHMDQTGVPEQRRCARVPVVLDVHLGRKIGNDVVARTSDLSVEGARVFSSRPLRVDEELQFDLELPAGGEHLTGTARVLRQHRHDLYALRFEKVGPAVRGVLDAFVEAGGRTPLV
jgi:hypothetical protein